MKRLEGKVAVVAGAGTGIGRASAVALVREGARALLAGRRADPLHETARLAEDAAGDRNGTHTFVVPTDVSVREAVARLVERMAETCGRADILVNSAGINTQKRALADVAPEDWDRVVDVNLTGAFNLYRAFLPHLRRTRGVVINISSMAGIRVGLLGGAAYCASKHGMNALTQSINLEEWRNGIRACVICPGEVDTPILEARATPVTPEHRATMLLPEDVASAVLFAATQPQRALVDLITIRPSAQWR